jgi:hypothetical protein
MCANPRMNPVVTPRGLPRPGCAGDPDRPLHHGDEVCDRPRRNRPWLLRLVASRGQAEAGDRHHHARCEHAWRYEIEPETRFRFHEDVRNEHGTGENAGQHDRCEQAREDS